MLIPFTGPLDLTATLESGQAFRWRRQEPDRSGLEPWFSGVVFGNVVRVRRTPEGIEFHSAPDDESRVAPLLHDYMGLKDDLDAVYSSIGTDDRMRDAIDRYRGMRILRQEPWECLVSFICSANSNIRRISTNVEDLSDAFGAPVSLDGLRRSLFPTPERLAEAGETTLRGLGLGFRAKYVAQVATTVARGDVDLFPLREASYQEALEVLTSLPGVGDKVANCVLLFSLDKPEAIPVDVWVRRAIEEWYAAPPGDGGSPTPKEIRPWAQRHFGGYAGYASQYLFHRRRLQGRSGG